MATIVKDLGAATAYGYAVEKGYTGTEEEFAELMASYASVAESAADSADAAAQSATNASNSATAAATSASSASTAATTASTKAGEAETSAAAADGSASAAAQSATSASGSATSASESASAAAQSATSASGSATSASGSATAAAGSAAAAAASEAAAREVEESIPADYTALSEDVSELKSQIDECSKVIETEEDTADLYIADKNGNVLAEFVNGHIKTKNFDSSKEQSLLFPTDSSANLDFSDSQGYVIMSLSNGNIKTKNFDSTLMTYSCEYLFSDGKLMLSYGYTDDVDAVICMGITGANDLFDFHSFYTKPHSILLRDCRTTDLTQVWSAGTDLHSPFQLLAVNDPDGYNASSTDPSYSGGNHTMKVNGETYKTASSRYVKYYADGVPVSSGCGVFNKFEIRWANNIQAYNCVKLDGTGRTSLIEYHDMIFDGIKFEEHVTLVPQEDIVLRLWHGFQTVAWATSVCDHVRFIEGANRNIYTSEDESGNPISGNAATSGIVEWGDEHAIEITVDVHYALGKRQYYSGTQGAAMNAESHKGRFFIIYGQSVNMGEDTGYDLRGSYRFFSTINGEV